MFLKKVRHKYSKEFQGFRSKLDSWLVPTPGGMPEENPVEESNGNNELPEQVKINTEQDVGHQVVPDGENDAPQSMFLRLPAELRNLIYAYALTDNNIHVDYRYFHTATENYDGMRIHQDSENRLYGISYRLCSASMSDEQAYERTKLVRDEEDEDDSDSAEIQVDHYNNRHRWCLQRGETEQDQAEHRSSLPVALLRTCRQIHNEATGLFYAENTFSFADPATMNLFIHMHLSPDQRKMIRSIRLHCDYFGKAEGLRDLQQSTVDMLEGLRLFGLTIGHYNMAIWRPWFPQFSKKLERLEVIVGPKLRGGLGNEANKKRPKAEELERIILDERVE